MYHSPIPSIQKYMFFLEKLKSWYFFLNRYFKDELFLKI